MYSFNMFKNKDLHKTSIFHKKNGNAKLDQEKKKEVKQLGPNTLP